MGTGIAVLNDIITPRDVYLKPAGLTTVVTVYSVGNIYLVFTTTYTFVPCGAFAPVNLFIPAVPKTILF